MGVRDLQGKVAQRPAVGQRVFVLVSRHEARAIFCRQLVPVYALVVSERVLLLQLLDERIEGVGVAQFRIVVQGRVGRLDEVHYGLPAAVEGEGIGVHIYHGVAGREADDGVVLREQLAVGAEAAGEALLVVRRPDDILAADDLAGAARVRLDAGRGVGGRPAAAGEVALLQIRIAEDVRPVGDGVRHDALVRLAVLVYVAQAGLGLDGQRHRPRERRAEEVPGDGAQHLRLRRHEVAVVAVDEASLIFQDDHRLAHAHGKFGIGVVHRAADDDGAALVVLDLGRRSSAFPSCAQACAPGSSAVSASRQTASQCTFRCALGFMTCLL